MFTNLYGRVRVLETGSEGIPEVKELVGEEQAVVLVRLVLGHLVGPPEQEPL